MKICDKSFRQTGISFCLSVYNVKPYLEDCINSILKQNLNAISYEILCYDDCSNDGSYDLLLDLEKKNPDIIHVFRQDRNRGSAYSRNMLIEQASGEYIWFVDSDDMLYPGVVDKIYYIAKKEKPDVIVGRYLKIFENEVSKLENLTDFSWERVYSTKGILLNENNESVSYVWAGMFRREFIVDNNLKFDPDVFMQEDTLFKYEYSMKTNNIIKCDIPVYLYRYRSTSLMNAHDEDRCKRYYMSMIAMLKAYKKHLDNNDYTNLDELQDRILHSRQNVATCLARVTDTKYVKEQLAMLKKSKIYPFPFRWNTLKRKGSIFRKWLAFLSPIEPFFWTLHLINNMLYKI